MAISELTNWSGETTEFFMKLLRNKPRPGDILYSEDELPVKVYKRSQWRRGRVEHLWYVNVLIDRRCTGWYLVSEWSKKSLKALILPGSHERVKHGTITALHVVKYNERGTALLCEVVE